MADAYTQLLDATIAHLRGLKERGVRYVKVAPESLAAVPVAKISGGSAPKAVTPAKSTEARTQPGSPSPKPVQPVVATAMREVPKEVKKQEVVGSAAAKLEGQALVEAMDQLRARALACQKCPNLAASRKNVVFGVGDITSPLMFVGEAPGADEDRQGEPFVGAAGQLLTKIIHAMGYKRETVYIANVLKCRPDTPGQTSGNRKPTPDEMKTCLPYLLAQIELIQPKVIVALGATAMEGLLGITTGISRTRGHFQDLRGRPVMPTYHPSYLLHNQAMSEKRKVWEDMLKVLEKLDAPISEKQRNFFLPAKQ